MSHPFDQIYRKLAPLGLLMLDRVRHPELRLEPTNEEDPTTMDTLGTLIDKMITVDLKMWHNQESLYAIRRMSAEDFEARYGEEMSELHAIIKRCCDLNVQRSRLMDAIDDHFEKVLEGKRSAEPMHQHKTY